MALTKACEQESPGENVQYKNLFTEVGLRIKTSLEKSLSKYHLLSLCRSLFANSHSMDDLGRTRKPKI